MLTATTAKGKLSEEVTRAAESAPTAIIFMGLNKLDEIVTAYQSEGRGDLPVAIISNGSLPHQQVVSGTVDSILKQRDYKKPAAPAILIFGEGAAFAISQYELIHQNQEIA